MRAWAQTANVVFAHGGLDLAHSQVDVVAALAIVGLAILLAIGIRESAGTNSALVVIQLVALVGFVLGLAGAIHPGAYHPFAPLGMHGIVASAALVFFAYIGFDTVTVASEEAHMCLAIPGQVIEFVDEVNRLAKVDIAGVRRNVNVSLLDEDGESADLEHEVGSQPRQEPSQFPASSS